MTAYSRGKRVARFQIMSKQVWTTDKLTAHYTALADVSGAHMQRILDWAVANDRFVESEAKAPLFSIAGKGGDRLFAVFPSGHLYVWLEVFRFPGAVGERDSLVTALKSHDLLKATFDASAVKEGRTMSRKLGDLNEDELSDLLDILATYCL